MPTRNKPGLKPLNAPVWVALGLKDPLGGEETSTDRNIDNVKRALGRERLQLRANRIQPLELRWRIHRLVIREGITTERRETRSSKRKRRVVVIRGERVQMIIDRQSGAINTVNRRRLIRGTRLTTSHRTGHRDRRQVRTRRQHRGIDRVRRGVS